MATTSKRMSESDLVKIVNSLETNAVAYNDTFMSLNEERLRRYNGEPYGDEEEGKSSVLATDVNDLVNSDMTSLVRVFLGSGDIMIFEPKGNDDQEIQEAKDKTAYINHIIRNRPDSYKIIYDYLLDIEVQKMGVLHYFMDTEVTTRTEKYTGQTLDEITALEESFDQSSEISSHSIVEQDEKDGVYSVSFALTQERQYLAIRNIATEDFLLSDNAASVDDAPCVGHITWKTRGDLVADGMSEEKVASFTSSGSAIGNGNDNQRGVGNRSSSTMKQIRWRDEGGELTDDYEEWANELIRVVTMYAKVDFDGDGIAERRYIVKIDQEIIENEPYNHVPYAVASALPEAHKAIGDGRAALVMQDQKVKTVLQRQLLDNGYSVGNPRHAISDKVDMDDMLDIRLNGLVEVKGSPAAEIMPLSTQYIGQELLQVVQYQDSVRAQKTGSLLASQGLDADNLHKETATRFQGVERASEAKIELVARNIAETGFRKLYDGVCWTVMQFHDSEDEIEILGKELKTDPSDWSHQHITTSSVGLGAGDGNAAVENAMGIYQIQQQLKQQGSGLVDDQKIYNSLNKMIMGLGMPSSKEFINNPEIPEENLLPQLEKITAALAQSQQIIEQLAQQQSNPLAEAEMIKQQGSIAAKERDNATKLYQINENSRLKELEMVQKGAQFNAEQQKDYTELELEHNTDIPGQGV